MSKNTTYVTIPDMGGNAAMSIDDIIEQVTGSRPVAQQEVEEPGFLSQAVDSVGAIASGAPLVARGISLGWDDLWSGFDPNDIEAREEREAYERDLAAYQAKYKDSGSVPQWFAEAAGSSGQSLVGTGASLAGMLAGGLLGGIPGAAVGATAVGGATAGKMDYAEASRQLHEEVTRRIGRKPTDAEWQGILADMQPYLLEHAAIEGVGEGVGDAILGFAFKPFSPFVKAAGEAVGRGVGGRVLRGAGALGAGIGSEIVTETGQQWGQGHVEADMFGTEAPTLGEAFSEVAGPTAAQTVMTGGLMGGMRLGLNLLRSRGGNETGTAEGEQPINMDEPVQPVESQGSTPEVTEAQEEPVSEAVRRQTEWNREHPGMTMRNGKIVPILRADDLPLEVWQRSVNRGYDSSAAQEGPINPPRDFFGMEGVVSGRAQQGGTAIQPADSPAFGMETVSFDRAPMSRRFAESETVDLLGNDMPVNEVMPQDDAIDVEWRELPAQGLLGARMRSALPAPQVRPTSSMTPALRGNNGSSSVASGLMGAFMPAVRQSAQPAVIDSRSSAMQPVQGGSAVNVEPAGPSPEAYRPTPQQEERRGQDADKFLRDHVIVGTIPRWTEKQEGVAPVADSANPADSSRVSSPRQGELPSAILELMRQDAQNSQENPSEQSSQTDMREPEVSRPGATWEQTFAEAQKMPRNTLVDILSQQAIRSQRPDSARLAVAKYKKMPKSRLAEELADEIHGIPERTYKEDTVLRVKGFTPQEFRKFMGDESGTKEEFLDYIQKNLAPDDGSALVSIKRDYLKWRRQREAEQASSTEEVQAKVEEKAPLREKAQSSHSEEPLAHVSGQSGASSRLSSASSEVNGPAAKSIQSDPFGTAHTEYSGKPEEAIEYLLKVKEGHVPAAFHKEGLGDIDLPWGKGGKKGFGLAHIIERRNEQGTDGIGFARKLPAIIREGKLEKRTEFPGRAYIVNQDNEAVVRLEWNGEKRLWLVTSYPYAKKSVSEPRLDVEPSGRTHGDEQHLPSSHSESADSSISAPAENRNYGTVDEPNISALSDHFRDMFAAGHKFRTILEARTTAAKLLKSTLNQRLFKLVDEIIELGVIKRARQIVEQGKAPLETYRELVNLYGQQPNLSVRTSTSIAQQAYSTPVPIAYLTDLLAGVTPDMRGVVYEPTAGNGALLINAGSHVVANELNHDRAERLRSTGLAGNVQEHDATDNSWIKMDQFATAVVANPPFGTVKDENGRNRVFNADGFETTEIDQAIMINALKQLKPNGRAVVIIGGKMGSTEAVRSKKYNTAGQRAFYKALFDRFNVVDHISLSGDLYSKQGAKYPIDIIVIDGHRPTENPVYPAGQVPRMYTSFEELEEVIRGLSVERGSERPVAGDSRGEAGDTGRERVAESGGRRSGESAGGRESSGRGREPDGRREGHAEQMDSESERRGIRNADGMQPERNSVQSERGQRVRASDGERKLSDEAGRDTGRGSAGTELVRSDGRSDPEGSRLDVEAERQAERPALPKTEKAKKAAPKAKSTATQTAYAPMSDGFALGTLVPNNMSLPVQRALGDVEEAHGDIDAYVTRELGYENKEAMHEAFAGEQVDALGMALNNIAQGKGLVLGDQTGIGKGRVCAGIIRWAKKQGKIPVFVTMMPDLYVDMLRDLEDTRTPFRPFLTNQSLRGKDALTLPDGSKLSSLPKKKYDEALKRLLSGELPEDCDGIFTTYNQLSGKAGEPRRRLLKALNENVVFILDEAHNAGGPDSNVGQFVREIMAENPNGALYSSATYAKRPDIMSLYNKTDLSLIGNSQEDLEETMRTGGLAMQQVVSAMLTESGQYIRREKSFEGATMETVTAGVDLKMADEMADSMSAIMEVSLELGPALEKLDKALKREGRAARENGSTGTAGASSTTFSSVMHNLVAQTTLAIKADAAVEAVKKAVKADQKPVITLSNTMGSFISDYAGRNGLKQGDEIHLSFGDIFKAYLRKSLEVKVKEPGSKKDEEKTYDIREMEEYDIPGREKIVEMASRVESLIDRANLGGLPVSPIDYIIDTLGREGIRAGEITGRSAGIHYDADGRTTYYTRESGPAAKVRASGGFNGGDLDCLIINRAGSTGISLHASEKFADQRRRNMIIVQPDLNIDVFMQTLGRVFRTGQVVPPTYQFLLSDMPSEKRPAAVLGKKMASLNANTTASAKGTQSFDNIPDFLNMYGDQAAYELLSEDEELNRTLGYPLEDSGKTADIAGLAAKMTGKIPLLKVKQQEEVYERLEALYKSAVELADANGTNGLDSRTRELDARKLRSAQLSEQKSGVGPFAAPSFVSEYDVKVVGKPFKSDEVRKHIAEHKTPDLDDLKKKGAEYLRGRMKNMDEKAGQAERNRVDGQWNHVRDIIDEYPIGSKVSLTGEGNAFEGFVTNIIFTDKKKGGNPVAPSSWKIVVDVADARRQISVPFSKLVNGTGDLSDGNMAITHNGRSKEALFKRFDDAQSASREKRYIVTGNLVEGYNKMNHKGDITSFRNADGTVEMGIVLPKNMDVQKFLEEMPVQFKTKKLAEQFMKQMGESVNVSLQSGDGFLRISGNAYGGYRVFARHKKAEGGRYYLDDKLIRLVGGDFVKSGQEMRSPELELSDMPRILSYLYDSKKITLNTSTNREAARDITGERYDFSDQQPLASSWIPGKHLPTSRKRAIKLKANIVQGITDRLSDKAENAAPVRVVQKAEELPANIRERFSGQLDSIEGVYDPSTGVVWMVADNLYDTARAAEVWAHEQIGHHGLRGMFTPMQRRHLLNQLWLSMGGMGNSRIREIADRYGIDPRGSSADRQTVMEELVAHLAEKRHDNRLNTEEQSLWKKLVNAVLRFWNEVVKSVSRLGGGMKYENIDSLLADLGEYVWSGVRTDARTDAGMAGAGAMASQRQQKNAVRYKKTSGKPSPNDFVLLPDGNEDFGIIPETTLKDGRKLKSAPVRLQRGVSRFGGGYGYEHINDVHGDEIRAAGYPSVEAFVWDLVHNYNQIWYETGGGLRFVKEAAGGRSAGFVRLARKGDFYEIRSAFPMVNSPAVRGGRLLWTGDPHQSTATEEQNPFITKSDGLAPTARTSSEGSLRSLRGQSNEENIEQEQGEDKDKKKSLAWARTKGLQLPRVRRLPARLSGNRLLTDAYIVKPVEHPELWTDKPLASLSRSRWKDRKGLNGLITEWSDRTGQKKDILRKELREYFEVDNIEDIPREWMHDAEDFVREKIDAIPEPDKPGFLDKLFTMDMKKTAAMADTPEVRQFFHDEDLGLFSHFVSLPHWIAKRSPAFARVYERQLKRMDERSAALKRSLEEVPSLFGGKRLGKQDMESLRKILWETEGQEPDALKGVEKFLKDEDLPNGRETIKANPEFYKAYDKWISGLNGTEAAKKALMEIRRSLDNDLIMAHNRMAAMGEVNDDTVKEFRQSIGHVPNYFPHHRYGKYYVQAKVNGKVVFRQHFDAAGKARAAETAKRIAAEQKGKFPNAKWAMGDNVRLPDEVLGAPIDTEAMEQIIRAATAKIGDKKRAQEISDLLMEGTADVLKSRGWGEHGIRRKGIPGFEQQDIARVLYDYKAGLNGWLTKMEAARDFGDGLRSIDAQRTPQLWKYTSQYIRDMLRNSDRIDRISGNIKSVAFAWYLGGSIKTAMVNLTQNFITGIPRLEMDVNNGAASWLRGAHTAIANRVTGGKSGLTEEEARLLYELDGESVITDAYMEEIRGQLGSRPRNVWNRFTKILGMPMSEVEKFNRASLALAAFRAARAGNMKFRARRKYGVKGMKADYAQAKAFAADVVKDSHFVYGKSNMPEFLRSNAAGRAASSMFTFRSFTFNMLGMWAWALRSQGREGVKFLARSLGATMALGGVTALPFYATAMALFQAASGDDDDWTELLRKALPENNLLRDVVCYGLPTVAGVNLGGSLQMETSLTRGLQKGSTPKEVLTESFGDIIGIPYDLLIEKPSKVADAARYGDAWRMAEEAAPVAVKNVLQAVRLHTVGQTTMSGRPINEPGEPGARRLSGAEAVGKALGFQPVSSTKSYAAYAARNHAEAVRGDMLDELTVLALKSYDTGEPAGKLEMRRKMREWNRKMEAEGKPHMFIHEKDVMRRVKARRRENRVTPKSVQQRERNQAVWG